MSTFVVEEDKYTEYTDRLEIIITMCDNLLLHHPVASAEEGVRRLVEEAAENLTAAQGRLQASRKDI